MPLKVVALNSALEGKFWSHVLQNVFDYYFYILDWKLHRDSTQILLALKEDKIKGMMLIYKQRMVNLRGSLEAAEALMGHLEVDKPVFMVPREHEAPIRKRFKPLSIRELIRMTLPRGKERLYIRHQIKKLTPTDAEETADLLKSALPEYWGETTSEDVTARMKNMLWLGIKQDGKLVSVGNTYLTDFGSNIGQVATQETHRGKGYATSIVSALVKEIMKKSKHTLIHMQSDNLPAIHIYTKVGFKPYKTYLKIEGEKLTKT